MAELQIPDYMINRPASITDLAESMMRMKESGQNQRLNEMKMAEAEQLAPVQRQLMQSQAAHYQSQAGLEDTKAQQAKQTFAINGAKRAVAYANKMAKEGTPEWEQAVLQAATPIAQALGHNDPNKPIDIPSLKALAGMDIAGGEYHPPVATSQGYLKFDDGQFTPMLNEKGQPYMPSAADVGLRGRGRLAEELSQLYTSGGIDQPTYERLIAHAVSGQPDIQQPMLPQAQAPQPRPQVHIDPNMSPADQATAQQDWDNYQKGVQYQGGGVPATSGGIPSLADTERLKAGISAQKDIDVANAKSNIELAQKRKEAQQEAQQGLPVLLDNSNYLLSLIDSLKTHKGLEGVVGFPNLSGALGGIRNTAEKDFNTRLDQIKGKTFQEAFASLKGAGAITDVEGKKASEALARLDTAQTEKEFKTALNEFQNIIKLGQTRAKEKAGIKPVKIESNAPSESQANQFKIEPINE